MYIPVFATSASLFFILCPMKLLAVAHFTEITGKWIDFKKAQKREKFPDSILHRCPRKAPFVVGL